MSSFKDVHKRSLTQGGTSMPNLSVRSSFAGLSNNQGVSALGVNDSETTVGNEHAKTSLNGLSMVMGADAETIVLGNDTCTIQLIGTIVESMQDFSTGLITVGNISTTGVNIGNDNVMTSVRNLTTPDILQATAGIYAPFIDAEHEKLSVGTTSKGLDLGSTIAPTLITGSILSIDTPQLNLFGFVNAYSYENTKGSVLVGSTSVGVSIGRAEHDTNVRNLVTPDALSANGGVLTSFVDASDILSLGTLSSSVTIGNPTTKTTIKGIVNTNTIEPDNPNDILTIGSTQTIDINIGVNQASGNINVGTGTRTGFVNIGRFGTDASIIVNADGTTVNGTLSTIDLQATDNTGDLDFATDQTSGNLNIGTHSSRTGDINIGRNSTSNLAALSVTSTGTSINGDLTVTGAFSFTGAGTEALTATSISSSGTLSATGVSSLGAVTASIISCTGTLSATGVSSLGAVTASSISSTGLISGSSGINISAGTGQCRITSTDSSVVGVTSSSLYCNNGGSGGCYVNAFPAYLLISSTAAGGYARSDIPFNCNAGLTATSFTTGTLDVSSGANIGSSSSTTTMNGLVNFSSPINTSYSSPTLSSQVGYVKQCTVFNSSVLFNRSTMFAVAEITLSAGNWLIHASHRCRPIFGSPIITYEALQLSTTNTDSATFGVYSELFFSLFQSQSLPSRMIATGTYFAASTTTIYLVKNMVFSGTATIQYGSTQDNPLFFTATRIL